MEKWEHMSPYQFCEGLTDIGVGVAEDDATRGSRPYPEACTSSTHCAKQTIAMALNPLILIPSLLHTPNQSEIRSKRIVSADSGRPSVAITKS